MSFERFEDLPAHVRAAMSEAQRSYYRTVLDGPKLGHGYVTAHRQAEVITGDAETHRHFGGYFFDGAFATFESFAEVHHRREPTQGLHSDSTVANRLKRHYPDLMPRLRARLSAMFELPQLAPERARFDRIETAYYADLTSADQLARNLEGAQKQKSRHDNYRVAFFNIHDDLRDLLLDLVAIGDDMQRRK